MTAVMITRCLILFDTIGTDIADVYAATREIFIAEISNTPTGGSEEMIDCYLTVTKEAENDGQGEAQIGDEINGAIAKSTEGIIEIPNEVTNTATGKTYTVTVNNLGKGQQSKDR